MRERTLELLTRPTVRLSLLGVLAVAALVAAVRTEGLGVDAARQATAAMGPAGPVVFTLVYAAAVTALLPASGLTLAGGVLFGPALGTATAVTGATLGSVGAFLLGRALGRDAVARLAGPRLTAIDEHLAERGFATLLIVRLVPLPFSVVNLSAGLTGARLGPYAAATALGILPGTFALAALGGTIHDPLSPAFLGAAGLFVVVTASALLAARASRRRRLSGARGWPRRGGSPHPTAPAGCRAPGSPRRPGASARRAGGSTS